MRFIRYSLCALVMGFTVPNVHAQWTKKANVPLGATDAACCFAIGTKVYIGGGSVVSKAFFEYNTTTDRWTPKAPLPVAKLLRSFGVSFAIGSKGYVALGQSDTANGGQPSVTNDLWQ